MNRTKALKLLREYRAEAVAAAETRPLALDTDAWSEKVLFVLNSCLDERDELIRKFKTISYRTQSRGRFDGWFISVEAEFLACRRGLNAAAVVIESAILTIDIDDEPQEEFPWTDGKDVYDPELWHAVRNLVRLGEWDNVASQAAIFVEDRLRRWAGDPRDQNGTRKYGKGLVGHVLGDQSSWRLGSC